MRFRRQVPELASGAPEWNFDQLVAQYASDPQLSQRLLDFRPEVESRPPSGYVCLAYPDRQDPPTTQWPDTHFTGAIMALSLKAYAGAPGANALWDSWSEYTGLWLQSRAFSTLIDPLRHANVKNVGSNLAVMVASDIVNPHTEPSMTACLWPATKLDGTFSLSTPKKGLSPVATADKRLQDALVPDHTNPESTRANPDATVAYTRQALAHAITRDLKEYGIRVEANDPKLAIFGYHKLVEQAGAIEGYRQHGGADTVDHIYLQKFVDACLRLSGPPARDIIENPGLLAPPMLPERCFQQFVTALNLLGRQPGSRYAPTERPEADLVKVQKVVVPGAARGVGELTLRDSELPTTLTLEAGQHPATQVETIFKHWRQVWLDCIRNKSAEAADRAEREGAFVTLVHEMSAGWESSRVDPHRFGTLHSQRYAFERELEGLGSGEDIARWLPIYTRANISNLGGFPYRWALISLASHAPNAPKMSANVYARASEQISGSMRFMTRAIYSGRQVYDRFIRQADLLRPIAQGFVDNPPEGVSDTEIRNIRSLLNSRGLNYNPDHRAWITLIAADAVNNTRQSAMATASTTEVSAVATNLQVRAQADFGGEIKDKARTRRVLIECLVLKDFDFANQPPAVQDMLARRMHKILQHGLSGHRGLPPAARAYYDMYRSYVTQHKIR